MNNNEITDAIQGFFTITDQKIQQFDTEITNGHEPYILLLALLDTLSLYAFPDETDNRKRFIKLIDNYSNWNDKDRISLIQLQFLLKRIIIPLSEKYTELVKEVETRINKWQNGRVYRSLEVDPLLSEFNQYKDGLTDHLIHFVRYPSLLYVMRNWLVHTFSKPGAGIDFSSDKSSSYYHGMYHNIEALKKNDVSQKSWELVIPPQVVLSIIKECSKNLRKYFEENSINPDKRVIFTECWASDRDIKGLENRIKKGLSLIK
jgi:hypothetical protein